MEQSLDPPVFSSVVLCLGERYVSVSAPSHRVELVRRLFLDEIADVEAPVGQLVTVEIDGQDRIRVDGRLWEPEPGQALCDQLMYALMRSALDAEPSLLHLHAGLVGGPGGSVAVAGLAGSGKSTLIADLVSGGFDYFTDERVGVSDTLGLSVLRKPISVVAGSYAHLAEVQPSRTGKGAESDRAWHIPASVLAGSRSSGYVGALPGLGAVVISEFRPGAAASVEEVHPATAARLLLSDALDVDRYGPQAVLLVARLCASVPCWTMVHSGGGDAVRAVQGLLTAAHRPPCAVHPIAPGTRPAWRRGITVRGSSVLGVASRTAGAVVGDRALVRTASGDLVELDDVSTAWLLLLDGRTSVGALVEEVAAANSLDPASLLTSVTASLAHLASLGVAA